MDVSTLCVAGIITYLRLSMSLKVAAVLKLVSPLLMAANDAKIVPILPQIAYDNRPYGKL